MGYCCGKSGISIFWHLNLLMLRPFIASTLWLSILTKERKRQCRYCNTLDSSERSRALVGPTTERVTLARRLKMPMFTLVCDCIRDLLNLGNRYGFIVCNKSPCGRGRTKRTCRYVNRCFVTVPCRDKRLIVYWKCSRHVLVLYKTFHAY